MTVGGEELGGQGWSGEAYQEGHQAQGPPATRTSLPKALDIPKGLSCRNNPGYTGPEAGPFLISTLVSANIYLIYTSVYAKASHAFLTAPP